MDVYTKHPVLHVVYSLVPDKADKTRYLNLGEDLGFLAFLQAGGEVRHDVLLCTNHLHYLLITLYSHALFTWDDRGTLVLNEKSSSGTTYGRKNVWID